MSSTNSLQVYKRTLFGKVHEIVTVGQKSPCLTYQYQDNLSKRQKGYQNFKFLSELLDFLDTSKERLKLEKYKVTITISEEFASPDTVIELLYDKINKLVESNLVDCIVP